MNIFPLTTLLLLVIRMCLAKKISLLKYIFASDERPKKVRDVSQLTSDNVVLDFIGLVQRHGYPAEEHNVTTDDGYILTMHRIPNSPLSDVSKKKPVVFIQHGMTASSDSWVLFGPEKDLPFLLADAGYDVWLGNFRGNTYGRSHVKWTTDDPIFWEFSYNEVALYDIPAYIDYILKHTNSKDIYYIGHSMGTTVSFVMLSSKPSYNDKMRLVISLAPASYFRHTFNPGLKRMLDNAPKFQNLFISNNIYGVLPQSTMYKKVLKGICNDKSILQSFCSASYFMISGRDSDQFNSSMLSYAIDYIPAGVSVQSLMHYYQNIMTGKFQAYDYGYNGNMAHYKKPQPPEYNVKKITAPVAIFYGKNDALTSEEDARELNSRLTNVVAFEAIPHSCFGHLDFVVANDVKSLVHDRLLSKYIETRKHIFIYRYVLRIWKYPWKNFNRIDEISRLHKLLSWLKIKKTTKFK